MTTVSVTVRRSAFAARPASACRSNEVRTMSEVPIVFVVDDDISVRESLELLVESAGWRVETFESGARFLARSRAAAPCCLLLDVSLPDLNGLDIQKQLAERHEM